MRKPQVSKVDPFFEETKVAIYELRKEITFINIKINDFARQLDGLREKPDVPAEFTLFRQEIYKRILQLESAYAGHSSDLAKSKEHRLTLQKLYQELLDFIGNAQSRITELSQSTSENHKGLKDLTEKAVYTYIKIFVTHKESMQKQMDDFKSSLQASPASILSTNEEIAKKVDDALKGLHNAMLTHHQVYDLIGHLETRIKKLETT
jgi:chromosome segregation ATPase